MLTEEHENLSDLSQAGPLGHIVGRRAELRRLFALVDGLPQHGGVLVVRGEAGIGKSILLDAARAHGRDLGLTVLTTTGLEAETNLPFSGLRDLLAPVISHAEALPKPQYHALMAAFGEVDHDDGPPQPFLIALAALNVLSEAAAENPVVIVVDDVQWLDPPTHDALAFVSRRVSGEPLAVVAGLREGDTGPIGDAGLDELVVVGLAEEAARELVDRHGSDLPPADRERILGQALGNPLALVELPASRRSTRDLEGDLTGAVLPLSARLERAFASRLDDLEPDTRDVLLVAAVSSDDSLQVILSGAGQLSGRSVGAEALRGATTANLLQRDPERVRFRHPLVRSGVLQLESLHRRQQAHRALAQVWRDDPYRRTWHRAQATIGKDDQLADELEDTHVLSIRRGSVPAAIAALERSAQLTTDSSTRGRRLLLAAEHAFGLGRADMVDRLLEAATRNTLTDLERARMEWLREIFNDGVPGDATRVIDLCDVARRSAAHGDTDLALNLLLGAALRCWWAHAGERASRRVVEVADGLAGVGDDPRFIAVLAVAEPNLESARVRSALESVVLETVTDADHLRLLGMAAHAIGDPVLSIDFLDRAGTRLREQGRLGLLSHALTMSFADRVELGDLARARAAGEEARQIAGDTGQPIWDIGTLSLQAMLLGVEGAVEEAHRAAAEAEQLANGRRLNDLLACVQLARGFAFCSEGQYADAYAALRRLFDPGDPAYHQAERFHGVMYLAEAAAHSGAHADVVPIMIELHQLDQVIDSPMLRRQLSYADAVLADDSVAEGCYRRALSHDLVRWPLLKARLELAFGSWLRRQRRVTESRLPLRSAQVAFDVMGATAWAEQAKAELRAAGQRVAGENLPVAQRVLSAQEFQIAQLVAEGLSNREIGERLYLSPRTVGSHLYRMFPKLEITSRGQVASRLRAHAGE